MTFWVIDADAAKVLARVNSDVISLEEFNKTYDESAQFFQFKKPEKKDVLEDLIKRSLGIQEARRLGLDKDPVVQQRIETVLYHAVLEKQLGKQFEKIFIKDKDAERYYSRNPEIRSSHIFIAAPATLPAAERKKAREKLQNIRDKYLKPGKMSFAEVAQKFSEGVSAPMGGDIDYQTADKLDPAYYAAASRMKKGQVSSIIESSFGYHIIKLTDRRPWSQVDQARIKRIVFEQEKQKIFERYMRNLRSKSKVSVNTKLLN